MNIKTKLALIIITFFIFISAIQYFTILESQETIKEQIAVKSVFLTASIMADIDDSFEKRLEEVRLQARDGFLRETVQKSNHEFEKKEDFETYINIQDKAWKEAQEEEITPFMQKIIENNLSKEIRKIITFYEENVRQNNLHISGENSGFVFSEIIITNKYGANVAQSGKTSDYRQNDESWWKEGKEKGFLIEEIAFDESAKVYSTDVIVRIDDDNGNFIGVIKAVLNIDEIIAILEEGEKHEKDITSQTSEFKLVTNDGRLIYATEKESFSPLEDVSNENFYTSITKKEGYFIITEEIDDEEKLFAYTTSLGSGKFEGLEWILLLELKTEEILAPLEDLQKTITIALFTLGILIIGIAISLSVSISRPIKKLSNVAEEVGKGNFNATTNIKRKDELGILAKTIDNMVKELKRYQKKLLQAQITKGKVLESEVKKKTKELQTYIDKLETSRGATLNILRDLKDTNKHLKDLDKAKSNFLNIVSHELKTPLTAIFAYLDIMDESKDTFNEEQLMSFKAVKRNSDQLQALINNILEISRIEAGKFELIATRMNVKEKIKDIVTNLQPLAENNQNKIVAKIKNIPKTITTDEQRFTEILNNLISNAIKFTENGTITVQASKQGDKLLVRVQDTGVGIPKDKVGELFQKFYQVDASVSRKYGGTGLGLSITKQLIELQGGKIWVQSKAKKGTTFSFTLPIQTIIKKGGKK